jgi:hypothetical protein
MTISAFIPQTRGAAWYGPRLVADDASGVVWTILAEAHGRTTCDRCGASGLGHLTAEGDWREHDMHCERWCRRAVA